MMGLSLGPASGKVMADLVNGKKPEVAIDAFHPERFS
jgi:D-amino-acid dehydrogenase